MQLSLEERLAVENGQLVRYVIPESSVECFLVRGDKLGEIVEPADLTPCHPDDLLLLVGELLDDEDWTIPDDRGRPYERSKS